MLLLTAHHLQAANATDVVADKVPAQLTSKLLDYFRPGKNARSKARPDDRDLESVSNVATVAVAPAPDAPVAVAPAAASRATAVVAPPAVAKGPLNYPTVKAWLLWCEEDLEHGRDNHNYTSLFPVFTVNGCTRVDDVARLSADSIMSLAEKEGVVITVGLANRLNQYANEDVARVKLEGKLSM